MRSSYENSTIRYTEAMSEERNPKLDALRDLGVEFPADFYAIEVAPIGEARFLLEALKKRVKDNFRTLAKVVHPDVNGGDEAKTARFRLLATVHAEIERLVVEPPPAYQGPFHGIWGVPVRVVRFT
jgi:anaerobic glycerol-3-phosphate dehydrogenase